MKLNTSMIELDGSHGEGGGQILRTALALSLATGQAFRMENIRAKRPKPGLMRQHLACVQAAVAVGSGPAHTQAVNHSGQPVGLGETTLRFTPGAVKPGDFAFAVGSAGSCTLVLQTVLWPLLMANASSNLVLQGGTHNPMAPSLSYLQLLDFAFAGGQDRIFSIELRRHGFYPAGGGEAHVQLLPPAGGIAPPVCMQRGEPVEITAHCLHAGLPKGVAERELTVLKAGLNLADSQLHNRALRSNEGPGNALMVVLRYTHSCEVLTSYGSKALSAEQVAHDVLRQVRQHQTSPAPVGEYLADQLMIPLALAALQGRLGSYWATGLSEHAKTNAGVIEKFLPVRFVLTHQEEGGVVFAVQVLPSSAGV